MNKREAKLDTVKLVGIVVRTSNNLEANPETAKIGKTIEHYFKNNLNQKISARAKPGTTYCVYTEYESDEHGEYTYFVGEETDCHSDVDPIFTTLTIPASSYIKFECGPGEMPMICIDSWKKIWQMQDAELGGKRTYIADFEIYDERAKDYLNTILDIYIGVRQ